MSSPFVRRSLTSIAVAAVAATGALALPSAASAASTITVGVGGDFATISAAVDAAASGDTIEVLGGTYAESVAVTKPLTLRAEPGTRVIPGPTYNHAGFRLQADDVTIDGFVIGDPKSVTATVGVDVGGTSGARIVDSVLVHNQRGVSLSGASEVVVSGTRFYDNNGDGPENNAALWGNDVHGITVEDSTFAGHTNTAINLAGSSQVTISGSRFEDNGNVAVIWNDQDVTISGNTGTQMHSSGVFVTQSTGVTISGNDLAAAGGASGVSVSNASGASRQISVRNNVLSGFVRGVNVADDAASDSVGVSGNRFLTSATGVRNQGDVLVDARGNWWGAASGPADANAADKSLPATNPGSGVAAEGFVDYRNWSVTDSSAPVQPVPVVKVVDTAGTVKVVKSHRRASIVMISTALPENAVQGKKLRWRIEVDGKRAAAVTQSAGQRDSYVARFVSGSGKHVITIKMNGETVRTVRVRA